LFFDSWPLFLVNFIPREKGETYACAWFLSGLVSRGC